MSHALILASKSPRRKELLTQLGYQFTCLSADIDESQRANELPYQYVERLSIKKAQCIADQHNNSIVLGSDTCVVINNEILGKPKDFPDCLRQLQLLSNNEHQVLTAVAVTQKNILKSIVVTTQVFFKPLTETEIQAYWQTGEPQDKAGSYGIQGIAGQFVKHIHGSYSSVVGLPLYETTQLLSQFGLPSALQRQV